jgi:hypothetical protein
MFNLSIIDNVQFKWLNFIKSFFEKTGLNYLWNQQQPVHSVQLKFIVTILNFIHNISIGVLPSSPYVIKFGVVVLTPKIFLQN